MLRCPLTYKLIEREEDKMFLSCGHVYHVDASRYFRWGVTKCCVLKCEYEKMVAVRCQKDPKIRKPLYDLVEEEKEQALIEKEKKRQEIEKKQNKKK
jgi:hypothetical protein